MARVLEQEVNLSRRACWNNLELTKKNYIRIDNSKQNLNTDINIDTECYVRNQPKGKRSKN